MKAQTNKEYSEEPSFVKACEKAGIIPTRRQAAKFRRGEGAVYKITVLKRKDVHVPREARAEIERVLV